MDGQLTDRWTDRHTDIQRETKIPRHYSVAGYENGKIYRLCANENFLLIKPDIHQEQNKFLSPGITL